MIRLSLVVLLAGLGLALAVGLAVMNLSATMHEDIARKTQSQVETAVSVAAHYADEAKAGRMSEADAKSAAIRVLKSMRYEGREYFWITDLHTRMVLHPFKPELDGTDVSNLRDPKGTALFAEMTKVATAHGAGFVNYEWPKQGRAEPQPKVSYVKALPAWGWVIGSGVYVDDINAAVRAAAFRLAGLGLLMLLAVAAAAAAMGSTIVRPIRALTERMTALAGGDNDTPVAFVDLRNEVGQMARALLVFRDAALDRERLQGEAAAQRAAADAARQQREAEARAAALVQERVVNDVTAVAERLAAGDLTIRLGDGFPSDYAALRDNLNAALAKLGEAMRVVRSGSSGIRAGADEIAAAADDLSRRTEQQAAALEETTAALNELTDAVRRSADGARQARAAVTVAQEQAQYSGEVAERAVGSMNQIESSSKQVEQIIGVIDEIAFQTNLLALNAGVEAARAGDAGKGFAVVASEVRALAQRSAEAAKEIKSLITASTEQVGQGVDLVHAMGEALRDIVGKVSEVDGLVGGITTLAEEQSQGLSQVNIAMVQIDQSTQQNAAMVEQSTAAVHSLRNETNELARLMDRFELGEDVAARAGRPRLVRSAS
ncbi:methyl-accepting chemotaxis protein [Phenylobacterium sp.]|uniref:methyl-accepting chemotaxis protein n=1 Tax=Phenylobacterium sp. TaxID=1871053 RepID=UPI0025EB5C01|nr:methyl-accepting chemotaxis protein [Phenylobacterium sp.]